MDMDVPGTPEWLATILLAEDDDKIDCGEMNKGGDLHQQAVREAHMSLWEYAVQLGGMERPAWYVSSETMVIVPRSGGHREWRPTPDVFVVPDISPQPRGSYDVRSEGPMPPFVLEVASESTWEDDVESKATLYQLFEVREYLVFDPTGAFLGDPPVRGWHVADGVWQPWPPVARVDGTLVWESAVLGLLARPEGVLLRFDHPVRGPLPIRADLRAALARSEQEAARADAAEAEIARLRKRLGEAD